MEPKPFNMNQLDNFKNWLIANGAEILRVTSECEILRFKTDRPGVSLVYINKHKVCTLTGESEVAWTAFCSNTSWTAGNTNVKRRKRRSSVLYQTLKERDGDVCFYCGLALNRDFISIEHLLSINHGGSNHISNLVLTHRCCNNRVGHLSVAEKVRYREQQYQQRGLYDVKC